MLEKQEFKKRQKYLKKLFEEKKAEGKYGDWETQFWSQAHFPNDIQTLIMNPEYGAATVVNKILTQLVEKSYFYDYKKYASYENF